MKQSSIIIALLLVDQVAYAGASIDQTDHFSIARGDSGVPGEVCNYVVVPKQELFNLRFSEPGKLFFASSREFVLGSRVALTFDGGQRIELDTTSYSDAYLESVAMPKPLVDELGRRASVHVSAITEDGPVNRTISLAGFASGYAEFEGCGSE